MSRFACVENAPPVEIFALNKAYKGDHFPHKVDLGIGAYRTDEGKPWVLPVVRKVEKQLAANESLDHEYLPMLGSAKLSELAIALLLGEDNVLIKENKVLGLQCLSGTGSLRTGADFLRKCCKYDTVYISNPTWANHKLIFQHANFANIKTYRYWDPAKRALDFQGMLEDLENAPRNAVVILHACAHNPTGVDPTVDQWSEIADIIEAKELFPFFDCAYQGFASGDPDNDAWAVRHFASRGLEMLIAQSFAKNFGLYDQRVGNLTVIFNDPACITPCREQLTLIVRTNYSNPPSHGSKIVETVLSDPALYEEWLSHIKLMSYRITKVRQDLQFKLLEHGTPGNWEHITSQIGMFSYTGLTPQQVEYLVNHYHIYLPKNGRISMCGLNSKNIDYVAKAIFDAVKEFPN